MADSINLKAQIKLETQVINRINRGFIAAVSEVFEGAILTEARAMSPYNPEDKGVHNRDTIQVSIKQKNRKIVAKIFTESGHGGYLERGTSKMTARPYLHPAFEANIDALKQLCAQRVQEFAKVDQTIAEESQ